MPPLWVAVHLATRAWGLGEARGATRVLWIGESVWPFPAALLGRWEVREVCGGRGSLAEGTAPTWALDVDGALARVELELAEVAGPVRPSLEHTMYVAPRDPAARLWAVDAALRCASIAVVVFDGSGMEMAATRRLQLAAQVRGGVALALRPAEEARALSAATTRWLVGPSRVDAEETVRPRWSVELRRTKGVQVLEREPVGGASSEGGGAGAR